MQLALFEQEWLDDSALAPAITIRLWKLLPGRAKGETILQPPEHVTTT